MRRFGARLFGGGERLRRGGGRFRELVNLRFFLNIIRIDLVNFARFGYPMFRMIVIFLFAPFDRVQVILMRFLPLFVGDMSEWKLFYTPSPVTK